MKANLIDIQKIYNSIPNVWIVDGVRTDNYSKSETHFIDGWRDVVIPNIGQFQKLSPLYYYDEVNEIVTKEIINLTEQEIRDLTIPKQLSRMKFKMQVLITTGKTYEEIISFIQGLPMSEFYKKLLLIRLEDCVVFERYSEDLSYIAQEMGITETQLDEIFINGNLIE